MECENRREKSSGCPKQVQAVEFDVGVGGGDVMGALKADGSHRSAQAQTIEEEMDERGVRWVEAEPEEFGGRESKAYNRTYPGGAAGEESACGGAGPGGQSCRVAGRVAPSRAEPMPVRPNANAKVKARRRAFTAVVA